MAEQAVELTRAEPPVKALKLSMFIGYAAVPENSARRTWWGDGAYVSPNYKGKKHIWITAPNGRYTPRCNASVSPAGSVGVAEYFEEFQRQRAEHNWRLSVVPVALCKSCLRASPDVQAVILLGATEF